MTRANGWTEHEAAEARRAGYLEPERPPSTEVGPAGVDGVPLTTVTGFGNKGYVLICRVCGDVTAKESHGLVSIGMLAQVGVYRQRHLARHLTALAAEITDAAR